jgi:replicative DNA helicase
MKELAEENMAEVESRNPNEQVGIKTGFYDLDIILGGLVPERYYLLGARPGMGKTALLAAIARNVAKAGKKVGIISTEMGKMQLFLRQVASAMSMDTRDTYNMHMEHPRISDYMRVVGELSELGIYIESCADINASEFRRRAHRMKIKFDIDLLLMDYLQLVESDQKELSGERQITEISRCMVGLTKKDKLNIPLIAAAQLNRLVEQRQVKRPTKADLKGSGSLEADADAVMLLYRDEYYNKDASDRPNIAEIIVDKNRHGPEGVCDLYFQAQSASFRNLQRIEMQLPNLSVQATHVSLSSDIYGD